MRIIQTLYFDQPKDPYAEGFGWIEPEYHIISWALSCLQIIDVYGSVDLYCNEAAAKLLINDFNLPYTNVICSHNEIEVPNKNLWALPKIITYSLQTSPFLHVDGDVFLFSKLPPTLHSSELIAQNIEEATEYYKQTQQELINTFTYFPGCVEADFRSNIPIKAINAGILGGTNINFIQEYTTLAFNYITKNAKHLSSINTHRFNVFFEQHLFYSLAKEKGLKISVLISNTYKDNQYLNLGNFHEVPCKRKYLHLLGHYKKDLYTCRQMAYSLRKQYPEYYYQIVSRFKEKGRTTLSSIYEDEYLKSFDSYQAFEKKSKTSKNIGKNRIIDFLHSFVEDTRTAKIKSFTNKDVKTDLGHFSKELLTVLKKNAGISEYYLYGRDLEAASWYCEIFSIDSKIMSKHIERCENINVIQSHFDWSGIHNKYSRIGIKYYEELELERGNFYHLVIPETYDDGFSLHDIDEMENIILSLLKSPTSIIDLFSLMSQFVEEDVIQNHLEEYKTLFIEMLKQLTLKKAIKPIATLIVS